MKGPCFKAVPLQHAANPALLSFSWPPAGQHAHFITSPESVCACLRRSLSCRHELCELAALQGCLGQGSVETACEILQHTISMSPGNHRSCPSITIFTALQECLERGSVETARAILQHAVGVFPGKKSLYVALAQLERSHGSPEAVAEVLERGVKYCPQVRNKSCPHSGNPSLATHPSC